MNEAYLLLGSNEGDRSQWLQMAINLIEEKCGAITKKSSVYETAAWGINDQPAFLNLVIVIQTELSPANLLETILNIEISLGRQRHEKWGPRIIDIDILFYNDSVIDEPGLIIPHPFLHERRFTLVPLAELAPDFIHPKLRRTILELLEDCPDQLPVNKFI